MRSLRNPGKQNKIIQFNMFSKVKEKWKPKTRKRRRNSGKAYKTEKGTMLVKKYLETEADNIEKSVRRFIKTYI